MASMRTDTIKFLTLQETTRLCGRYRRTRGKPTTRVTSRKVGTVSFVSIADEGRSCGTKTPERARKSKSPGAEVSFGLIKPAQPATLKITEEEVDTVRVELILSIIGLTR